MTTYIDKNYVPSWINIAKPSRDTLDTSNAGADQRQSTVNAEGGVVPIVYGTQSVGAKLIAVNTAGANLVIAAILCEGPIQELVELDINDKLRGTGFNLETYLGDQTTTSPKLSSLYSGINYDDILNPVAYIVLTINPAATLSDATVLESFPRITAIIKGKKVYDPRDANQLLTDSSTWTWSNNPSLCLADLITSEIYGLSRSIDWDSVANCANYNDKKVPITQLPPPLNMWPYLPIATYNIVNHRLLGTTYNTAWTRTDLVDYYLNLPNIHAKYSMIYRSAANVSQLGYYMLNGVSNVTLHVIVGETDTLADAKWRIQKDIWDTRTQWGAEGYRGSGPTNSNAYTSAADWSAAFAAGNWTFMDWYGNAHFGGSGGTSYNWAFDVNTLAYSYKTSDNTVHVGFANNGRPFYELTPPLTLETSRQLDIVIDVEQETSNWIETLRGYAGCFVIADGNNYSLIPDKPIGYAFNAQGSSLSYVNVDPYSALDITGQMSLEISIKPSSESSGIQTIIGKGNYGVEDYTLLYDKSNSKFLFKWHNTDDQYITYSMVVPTLSTTSFTTLSLSLDNLGNLSAYIFDESVILITEEHQILDISRDVTSFTFGINVTVPSVPLTLAKSYNSPIDTYFSGLLDEFRLWSTARSLEEISFQAKVPLLEGTDSRLVCHLKFNEGFSARTKALGEDWVDQDLTKNFADINMYATLYSPTTDVSVWSQHDGSYDFYKFDGSNVVEGSVKVHKRGILNIPTIIEFGFTNTLDYTVINVDSTYGNLRPWKEDYISLDNSILHNNKVRVSRIPMPGIIRSSQATREAQERYNSIVSDSNVVFGALDDVLNITVGDGIQFHHRSFESSPNNLFKPYRVNSIQQKSIGRWTVSAIEYDPKNYTNANPGDPTFPDSNL